jgi:ferredoxin--NADP+ reductase
MTESLNAVVTQRTEVAPGLVILRVVPDGWAVPDFKAGQFAVLGLPGAAKRYSFSLPDPNPPIPDKLIKRAYSVASSSVAKVHLEFYVSLVPSGLLTPRLFALAAGDRVWLSPKITGMFTLDQVPLDRHIVLLATGTGVAPYMSMLRTHLVAGGPRRFAVIQGARNSTDLGYQSELMTMAHLCPNFTYIPSISRPKGEKVPWPGPTGHVQDVWASDPLTSPWGFTPAPTNTDIFLCGNPSMIDDTLVILERQGFKEHKPCAPGNVHLERYW